MPQTLANDLNVRGNDGCVAAWTEVVNDLRVTHMRTESRRDRVAEATMRIGF